jgi:hypothetical protein
VTITARLTTLVEEWPQSFKGDQKELVTIDFTPFLQAEVGRYHTVPYLHTQYNVIIFYQYSDIDALSVFPVVIIARSKLSAAILKILYKNLLR